MKITVYKGFNTPFLESLDGNPLVEKPICEKKNVLKYDREFRKQLDIALLSLKESDHVWMTYEEYSLIKKRIDDAIADDGLELLILKNNLYPDYYPIEFNIDLETEQEIIDVVNGNKHTDPSEACLSFIAIYNTLVNADGDLFGSFYNYEYESAVSVEVRDYYPNNLTVDDTLDSSDYVVFLNEDIDTYLRDLKSIIELKPQIISVSSTNGELSQRMYKSLQAYCLLNSVRLTHFHEKTSEDNELDSILMDIAKNVIRIEGFESFRTIKFYKNPDINKEVIELSQSKIIHEIIHQAERSYNYARGDCYRDIFITASTGAGKSVMFQIPAVYLAQKYNKLTIIIEPVKALMQDQKEKLNQAGYTRVEAFNSDLITQVEKEAVLQRIRNGEVDLLYLSPETLLSYSIEAIIGEREIGLVIVDEYEIIGLNLKSQLNQGFRGLVLFLLTLKIADKAIHRRQYAQNRNLSAERGAASMCSASTRHTLPTYISFRRSTELSARVDLHRLPLRHSTHVPVARAA